MVSRIFYSPIHNYIDDVKKNSCFHYDSIAHNRNMRLNLFFAYQDYSLIPPPWV
nr:MAG TPA: hypothetical protein [Myoviridae sp. ctNPX13]